MQRISLKSFLIISLLLLAITLLTYLPGMTQLGFYRDDWNNLFNAYTQGPGMLIPHYASDRPADGYLLKAAYDLFGPAPLPYLLCCLLCRFLSALCFWATLRLIWPKSKAAAFSAAVFFIVFPGFLEQVDGLAYLPHQCAMLCICLSIFLSILMLDTRSKLCKLLCCLAAVVTGLAEMFLMEYYIGLEALRFFLIGAYLFNRAEKRGIKLILNTVLLFLLFLAGAGVFLYWRAFMFDATRYGADLSDTLRPLVENPMGEGLALLAKWLKNWAKVSFGSWTVPAYDLLNGISGTLFLKAAAWTLLAVLIFAASVWRTLRFEAKDADVETAAKPSWQAQWIVLGAVSTFIVILPMLMAGREITFTSSLDRFTYPGSLCAIIFICGLIFAIPRRWIRTMLLSLLLLSAGMVQYVNKANYIDNWEQTRSFWWQLSWRAPNLADGAVVLANMGDHPIEEDYESFTPIHLIYRTRFDHPTIGTEILTLSAIHDIQQGIKTFRKVREIYVDKDYTRLLALSRPVKNSCLQVIDGNNQIYSTNEWSRIVEVGEYSRASGILLYSQPHTPPEEIFGPEPEHDWCYYYQKMALSVQREDWQPAAELADEAMQAGLEAGDSVEWLPLLQAYAYSGRVDEAEKYVEHIRGDEYLRFEACRYLENAEELAEKNKEDKTGSRWLTERICAE